MKAIKKDMKKLEKFSEQDEITTDKYDTKYYYFYDYNERSLKVDKDDESKKIKAKINFFENKKIKFYFNLVSPVEYEVSFE